MQSLPHQDGNESLYRDHRDKTGYVGEGVAYSNKPEWLKRLGVGRVEKEDFHQASYSFYSRKAGFNRSPSERVLQHSH